MEIEAAIEKLFSLHKFGVKLGLDNIKIFLDYINNPQKRIKSFHIAGSNGKGSTASFIASILTELGNKVGLYTSPHFIRFNERIKIGNQEIPNEYVAKFVNDYLDYIDENNLTFFEVTTALAFKYFADEKVDYAVIETGLGGRLDATNVLSPLAVVITSISLEHTNILGDTISKIAAEKAAIIKDRSKVFVGYLPDDALNVIKIKSQQTESELYLLSNYLNDNLANYELNLGSMQIKNLESPIKGTYQNNNAALAVLSIFNCLHVKDVNIYLEGIKNVIKNTGLEGRYEYYCRQPDVVFDSAHNPDGVNNFLSEFKKDFTKYQKRVLLFGAMKDKSIKIMLSNLRQYFDEIRITDINYERACKIDELEKIASEINLKVFSEKQPVNYIKEFIKGNKNNCLVVLGSMYVLGELKTNLIT